MSLGRMMRPKLLARSSCESLALRFYLGADRSLTMGRSRKKSPGALGEEVLDLGVSTGQHILASELLTASQMSYHH